MALVYRIEDVEGYGPYRGVSVSWGDSADAFNDPTTHPTPYDDDLLYSVWRNLTAYEQEMYSFGFTSEAQFKSWFYEDEWLRAMDEADLMLCVYDVPDSYAIPGNRQAVFRKDKANLVLRRRLI